MNLRLLFTINAILSGAHGVGFILLPNQLLSFYQITGSPGTAFMGQLFGTELLVVAIVAWYARNFKSLTALSAVVVANLVADVVGAVLSVRAVISGVAGPVGWIAVGIYGLLALGYMFVYIKKAYSASSA